MYARCVATKHKIEQHSSHLPFYIPGMKRTFGITQNILMFALVALALQRVA